MRPSTVTIAATIAMAALFVFWRLAATRSTSPPASNMPRPSRRFEVAVASTFPDQLQSYSGCAAVTPDDDLIAWCGHRSVDELSSGLVSVRAGDTAIHVIKCSGRGPDGFEYASAAYDPTSKIFYVFGGWADNKPTNELFRLDLQSRPPNWQKVDVKGVTPAARNGSPMVFDARRDRLIVCGGDAGTGGNSFLPLADCWQFDLGTSTWKLLPSAGQPSGRWHAAMAIDASAQKAYLFGGAGKGPFDAALYELDLSSNTWQALRTTGTPPPSLQGATLTFDARNRVLVLAGGLRHSPPGKATISHAWIYDASTGQWDESDCGEDLRRRDHLGIYCAASGEHLLVGGRVSATVGNFYDRGSPTTKNVRLIVRPLPPPP